MRYGSSVTVQSSGTVRILRYGADPQIRCGARVRCGSSGAVPGYSAVPRYAAGLRGTLRVLRHGSANGTCKQRQASAESK